MHWGCKRNTKGVEALHQHCSLHSFPIWTTQDAGDLSLWPQLTLGLGLEFRDPLSLQLQRPGVSKRCAGFSPSSFCPYSFYYYFHSIQTVSSFNYCRFYALSRGDSFSRWIHADISKRWRHGRNSGKKSNNDKHWNCYAFQTWFLLHSLALMFHSLGLNNEGRPCVLFHH